jgi:hypothetical protein
LRAQPALHHNRLRSACADRDYGENGGDCDDARHERRVDGVSGPLLPAAMPKLLD